jgi:hypothetical protein
MQSQQSKSSYEGYKPYSNSGSWYLNDQPPKINYYEEPKRAYVPMEPYRSPNSICDFIAAKHIIILEYNIINY